MKRLSIENIGFTEIGGIGEMKYTAVKFPEYIVDYTEQEQVIQPVFSATIKPTAGTDYSLTGQELLVSLCNLYRQINDPNSTEKIPEAIWVWCRNNIHPYNIEELNETINSGKYAHIELYDIIQQEATFSLERFEKDLSKLGRAFEYFFALKRITGSSDAECGRNLYYEGRLCDTIPFLERYKKIKDDDDYITQVYEDYKELTAKLLDLFPDFNMRLRTDSKGKVLYAADVKSVFDIAWYTFARMVADVSAPIDESLDYMFYQGSVLSCLACGEYFVRHSSRQLYCDSPLCQAERNRKNRRNSYARKKQINRVKELPSEDK